MDVKVEIDKKNKEVSLIVEVKLKPSTEEPVKYKTQFAIDLLNEKGFSLGKCVKNDVIVNKTREDKVCSGHWVFKDLTPAKPAPKPASKPKRKITTAKVPKPMAVDTTTITKE